MVAAQLLLMNHFFMSLTHNTPDAALIDVGISSDISDVATFSDINSVVVGMACSLGCTQCSEINGCLACKPPFFLLLNREGTRQTAFCTRACPRGFYKLKKKRNGFCAKCTMRGCVECLGVHYCSVCQKDFTNFFGKCITQPPENELEELEGIFVTRPPLAFPTSNGATTISRLEPTASILSTSPLPTGAETTNSTTPIRSTTPATSTTLSPASVVTVTSSVIASATAAPEGRDAETIQKGVFIPLFATLSPADRSHTPSTPSYNYDSRPCRRKLNRGKGKRRRKKGRKNRKGNKERRRGNINRRKNCENSQRSESKGHRKRNLRRGRHRGNRRGCRSRKQRKCRDSVVDKNSEGREGETTVAVSEERSITTTENKHKHSEKYDLYGKQEKVKVSLLEEPPGQLHGQEKRETHLMKSRKFFYRNRPRAMVEFKRSQRRREPKPAYVNGHRVRHGNPRHGQ